LPEHHGNQLRRGWSAGERTVGTWCTVPHRAAVEVVAQAGFDWVIVDWQHGHFGAESLASMIDAAAFAGAVPLVRVPVNESWMIQKALDLGGYGVVVPLVNTAADARRAAEATRYPPRGVRSFGPVRASRAIGWEPGQADGEVVCIVQIETAEALRNAEAIAATPGVDALFVGPADLALSLRLPLGAPELDERVRPVLDAAARCGLPVGRHSDTAEEARAAFAREFRFVAVASDMELLGAACAEAVTASRGGDARGRPAYTDNLVRTLVSSAPPAP
jgi:4-hydroxy-2-oxoheptanedioate aldolase